MEKKSSIHDVIVVGAGPAGAEVRHAHVSALSDCDGVFTLTTADERLHSRYLQLADGRVKLSSARHDREFDLAYLALGCSPQHDLARSLGAAVDEHGALRVNLHQETSVPRLYAAGDVVRGLNQVVVAGAESAVAATDIHNKLRAQG